MAMNEPFKLTNDPPKYPKKDYGSNNDRQTVLFAGMDCEPGQKDLFPTDGKEDS